MLVAIGTDNILRFGLWSLWRVQRVRSWRVSRLYIYKSVYLEWVRNIRWIAQFFIRGRRWDGYGVRWAHFKNQSAAGKRNFLYNSYSILGLRPSWRWLFSRQCLGVWRFKNIDNFKLIWGSLGYDIFLKWREFRF